VRQASTQSVLLDDVPLKHLEKQILRPAAENKVRSFGHGLLHSEDGVMHRDPAHHVSGLTRGCPLPSPS
jgi:hypothetical protein